MISKIPFVLKLVIAFLPFALFIFLNSKANMKKPIRNRQFFMPAVAVVYSLLLFIFMDKLGKLCLFLTVKACSLFDRLNLPAVSSYLRDLLTTSAALIMLIVFNALALLLYLILKKALTLMFRKKEIKEASPIGSLISVFYSFDANDNCWYIKEHLGQARTFIKAAYYGGCCLSVVAMLVSCVLFRKQLLTAPFYPVFAIIIVGELAFFVDGLRKDERKSELNVNADNASHVALYPLLRKPLRELFDDKLSSEGTTVNNGGFSGGSAEDILTDIAETGNHTGKNYATFIRKKMDSGLKPNVDYIRSGYELAVGKSLLFNTPFYDKLVPYACYAMNHHLLAGGKVLIVLGRHSTQEDLLEWCRRGMLEVSNVPDLWKISELTGIAYHDEDMPDIGVISRSGVHDLDIHKANLNFLKMVSFVVIIEPSRLVTTAQIGLNLLVKCCGRDRKITYCSVDRNCDGLVDSLSHILMTNLTEVSATEYPHGMSSYMCWTADDDYIQHRIVPGVSRYLGIGTELSFVALKNQVKKAVWYGGEAYPVLDAHWIAKQYYHDLLEYAGLPLTQETFDKYFQASFNMCNERVSNDSFTIVEDDRNNLFETRRNFATIAEQQGFVNVVSSEYMLREYMAENTDLFTVDAKAIPYITADFARTKRNSVLCLCLKLCIDGVSEKDLRRELLLLGFDTANPAAVPEADLWQEICMLFCGEEDGNFDKDGNRIICVVAKSKGRTVEFERANTILFKRRYSMESGAFESIYTIEDKDFADIILEDLQNAGYIAERDGKDYYIGTELKGHIYQKYLPGQFFTLNGKYYEMVSVTAGNRILVRRASEHINGRLSYRQVRHYTFDRLIDSQAMGTLKTVNGIDIHYQFADFSVKTPAYWKLHAYNDFANGSLVEINGVPERRYFNKQVLQLDFSKLGDTFTDAVRLTLTNLLNEVFVTLFAENQPFISALTPGQYDTPMTYSLELNGVSETAEKCIFIVEDSQLDLGLLIAVERNVNRILQIVSDYLAWNDEKIAESLEPPKPLPESETEAFSVFNNASETESGKKKSLFGKICSFFKSLFKKKDKKNNGGEKGEEKKPKKDKKAKKLGKGAPEAAATEGSDNPPSESPLGDTPPEPTPSAEIPDTPSSEPEIKAATDSTPEAVVETDGSEPVTEAVSKPAKKRSGIGGWFQKRHKDKKVPAAAVEDTAIVGSEAAPDAPQETVPAEPVAAVSAEGLTEVNDDE